MYSKCQGDKCICLLCPHGCTLRKGEKGTCGVRENRGNGCIELMCDGLVSGYANDPIEKKPLYHFYPGSRILSVGSFGCNLKCDFCQNSHISCGFNLAEARKTTPEAIVSHASQISQNIGIAFTYNEPVVWIEFMIRTAEKAKYDGLKTVMVSNGYVNPAALDDIIVVTDAFNIDLKFFSDESYRLIAGGSLKPVLKTLSKVSGSGRHLEITTLIVPGINDSVGEIAGLSSWIANECGAHTPLHLSRYHPSYRRHTPATPAGLIKELHAVASEKLSYVYAGNVPGAMLSDTCCRQCSSLVTSRNGYKTKLTGLDNGGRCKTCGTEIYSFLL